MHFFLVDSQGKANFAKQMSYHSSTLLDRISYVLRLGCIICNVNASLRAPCLATRILPVPQLPFPTSRNTVIYSLHQRSMITLSSLVAVALEYPLYSVRQGCWFAIHSNIQKPRFTHIIPYPGKARMRYYSMRITAALTHQAESQRRSSLEKQRSSFPLRS